MSVTVGEVTALALGTGSVGLEPSTVFPPLWESVGGDSVAPGLRLL